MGVRLALVVYRGELGGAEIVTADLARALRGAGVDASVVFALTSEPLGERLRAAGVPYRQLGMRLHRQVLYHPRRLAQVVAEAGDGAILVECGWLGAALRAGGYRGRIVGVEHGPLLELQGLPLVRRMFMRAGRTASSHTGDVDVAVSAHVLAHLREAPHAHRVECIHNGIDVAEYALIADRSRSRCGDGVGGANGADDGSTVLGSAGRMVPGKGFGVLLRALALVREVAPGVVLKVAGEGPEFPRLVRLAGDLGLGESVEFLGVVRDMPRFWTSCDIAVTPSDTFPESFSMVTLEAMACGLPVVATRNGGIPEVVADGIAGTLVAPGDPRALADAVLVYVRQSARRAAHAEAARERCATHFDIADVARRYLALFEHGDLPSPALPGR